MERFLCGDAAHPRIAATLHKLRDVSQEAGDVEQARQHWEELLRMQLNVLNTARNDAQVSKARKKMLLYAILFSLWRYICSAGTSFFWYVFKEGTFLCIFVMVRFCV